jgi:hypothetical protein
MAAPTIPELLKYANLQIASEALYRFNAKDRRFLRCLFQAIYRLQQASTAIPNGAEVHTAT